MILWRAFHIRNEVVHDKTPPPLDVSKGFLLSYVQSLIQIKHHEDSIFHAPSVAVPSHPQWSPPPLSWIKLNTDGSFGAAGDAGAEIVVRDHLDAILSSSCCWGWPWRHTPKPALRRQTPLSSFSLPHRLR
uniref:Uncharacterized protein n=1 Tax=Avena sativa TaxID=4498 RepID=A0ACD5UX60_AVESA